MLSLMVAFSYTYMMQYKLYYFVFPVPYKAYTDDTAMTRCVAQSLIDKKEYNAADVARK